MMKLVVKHQGKIIQELTLEAGAEYLLGRAPDCAIVLQEEKGISRHHAKVLQKQGVWHVELVSKLGKLLKNGNVIQSEELQIGDVLAIPPFEIQLEPVPQMQPSSSESLESQNMDASPEEAIFGSMEAEIGEQANPMDVTIAGVGQLAAYLKVTTASSPTGDSYRLEGNVWTLGRDPGCEIHIGEEKMSRKHLELSRTDHGFFVSDLESSNGTLLNGERLQPKTLVRIESGDTIEVGHTKIIFEIHDKDFSAKASQLPAAPASNALQIIEEDMIDEDQDPNSSNENSNVGLMIPSQGEMVPYGSQSPYNPNSNHHQPSVVRVSPRRRKKANWLESLKEDPKSFLIENKIRVLIALMIPLLIYGLAGNQKPPPIIESECEGKVDCKTAVMTEEKKKAIKEFLNLAQGHLLNGRYSFCLDAVKKLKEISPYFESSKEIEAQCQIAWNTEIERAERERVEKENLIRREKVKAVAMDCRNRYEGFRSLEELRSCLAPALEIDPGDPLISDLETRLQVKLDGITKSKALQAERAEDIRRAQIQYSRGQSAMRDFRYKQAIEILQKLVSNSDIAGSEVKSLATRDIAIARKELGKKVAQKLAECTSNFEKGTFKLAYTSCEEVLLEDPVNASAIEMKNKSVSEIKKILKGVWDEAILEENMGNIDSAKEKWKKILDEDIKNGSYADKAQSKLKKYGIGL